jgi:heme/copper-type cytochrome/quinol oxidase subunit 1
MTTLEACLLWVIASETTLIFIMTMVILGAGGMPRRPDRRRLQLIPETPTNDGLV